MPTPLFVGLFLGAGAAWTWGLVVRMVVAAGGSPEVAKRRLMAAIGLHFILVAVIVWPYRQTLADPLGAAGIAAGVLAGLAVVSRSRPR